MTTYTLYCPICKEAFEQQADFMATYAIINIRLTRTGEIRKALVWPCNHHSLEEQAPHMAPYLKMTPEQWVANERAEAAKEERKNSYW